TIVAIDAEIDLAALTEQRGRLIDFGAVGERPLRDAGKHLARNVAVLRAERSGNTRRSGYLAAARYGAAGKLGRARRVDEAHVLGIGIGAVRISGEPLARPHRKVDLDALRAHPVGIRQVPAQHAELAVAHV